MPQPLLRVGFLNSHPIQYAAPLYAYLAQSGEVTPVALYLTDFSIRGGFDKQFGRKITWDTNLLSGYEHHFVGKNYASAEPYGFFALKGDGIKQKLVELSLDALVVHGHNFLAMNRAVAAARALSIPVFYKGETHLGLPRSPLKSALRRPAMAALFSQMTGFLAISQRNKDYYRSFNIAEDRIFDFPYTVENDRLIAASTMSEDERRKQLEELGLRSDLPVVIYASKFMHRKHPDDLIAACALLQQRGEKLQLLFVGTGDMESELRDLAAKHPALPVVFAGFQNQSQLPRILGASDIFVLPSENEPFGLIINEAMCAGLPIVAAEEIGSVPDLVLQDRNGRVFDAGDISGLADALQPLVGDAELRRAMGQESLKIIGRWSFARNLAGMRQVVSSLSV